MHVEGQDRWKGTYHPGSRKGDLRRMHVLTDLICIPVRSEINRCRETMKTAAEALKEEKIKLDAKVGTGGSALMIP